MLHPEVITSRLPCFLTPFAEVFCALFKRLLYYTRFRVICQAFFIIFLKKVSLFFQTGFVMRFSGRIALAYSHVFHTSGQYPTVACLPFRTIGVLNIAGFSSSFSILSPSYARYCSVLSLYAFEEVSMSFS